MKSAWSVAWAWAGEWWGSVRFWLLQAVLGGIVFLLVWLAVGDTEMAAVATVFAAVLTFAAGLSWKAWTIWADKRRRYMAAVIRIVEGAGPAHQVPTAAGDPAGPSERESNLERFSTYIDEQMEKLHAASHDAVVSSGGSEAFVRVASRTADGIRRFDSSLGSYVDTTISQVSVYDRFNEMELISPKDVKSVIDAIEETRTLYDGRDPVVHIPF